MINKKVTTILGLLIVAAGEFIQREEVVAAIPAQYTPWIKLIGLLIVASGPSLIRTAPSRVTDANAPLPEITEDMMNRIADASQRLSDTKPQANVSNSDNG